MTPTSKAEQFSISGVVEEKETGRPLRDLIIRAFDKDVVADDLLGYTTTKADGRFEIRFGPEKFRDVWESRPDIYLKIFDSSGTRLIHDTEDVVRRNATNREHIAVKIPAAALAPRRE